MIIPVVLSGGAGTRLWPLSTPDRPKQFLPLLTDRTLFQETLLRLEGVEGLADPIVVCNESHRFLVAEQLRELDLAARAIVLEPAGRNTAPAIAAAALIATTDTGGAADEPDPVLLVLPADHVIANAAAFRAAIALAMDAAKAGMLVTFGVLPTHAETGYGYIEQGRLDPGGWAAVERFVEKPDAATAERYVASGRFLWNSGMFVFRASAFLGELEAVAPDIVGTCRAAIDGATRDADFTRLGPVFLRSPSDSIDYAVMEKTGRAAVVSLDAGWSDIGSWNALHAVLAKDDAGNANRGDVVVIDARDNLIFSGSRKIALIGVEGLAVIESGDALLVLRKERSQDIKLLQQAIEKESS